MHRIPHDRKEQVSRGILERIQSISTDTTLCTRPESNDVLRRRGATQALRRLGFHHCGRGATQLLRVAHVAVRKVGPGVGQPGKGLSEMLTLWAPGHILDSAQNSHHRYLHNDIALRNLRHDAGSETNSPFW